MGDFEWEGRACNSKPDTRARLVSPDAFSRSGKANQDESVGYEFWLPRFRCSSSRGMISMKLHGMWR